MAQSTSYEAVEPTREQIDAAEGPLVVEFGTPWCGHCRAAQPLIAAALANRPSVRHVKIEDGSGRRLGRSFGVKLWPTLVFMRDGTIVRQTVRPSSQEIDEGFRDVTREAPPPTGD